MTATITTTGLCPVCEETIRIRNNGTLYRHEQPYDPDGPIVGTITDGGVVWHTQCGGSGRKPAVALPMTFARWLHGHAARRDAHENPVTYLAQRMFRGCSYSPRSGPADVDWSTAGELHEVLHREGFGREGGCDWLCGYVEQAGEDFARSVGG
ncbi:hypothetical protein OG455_41480 [Kitasatospora sp. NBC_01287]|uniref:hypothetical protein n=1 Tax=Kitasatospora sp. NBC_01287 TaxID=2903573 RepID=UPI002256DF1B|nr:hypothetical protein [Kitasatospora sp. NBC_01287]MCX4750956.1 hypothetical protein [Kitasatospora sp. NBC_01287]MCX4751793.1 hypothetical protein [Kitasatospora sp. NBC_01287]MCX4751915.1 hypothetical protein [Kitasatospora sp. NBC_01287]